MNYVEFDTFFVENPNEFVILLAGNDSTESQKGWYFAGKQQDVRS